MVGVSSTVFGVRAQTRSRCTRLERLPAARSVPCLKSYISFKTLHLLLKTLSLIIRPSPSTNVKPFGTTHFYPDRKHSTGTTPCGQVRTLFKPLLLITRPSPGTNVKPSGTNHFYPSPKHSTGTTPCGQVRTRGGFVFEAHRLLNHSNLGVRAMKKRRERGLV